MALVLVIDIPINPDTKHTATFNVRAKVNPKGIPCSWVCTVLARHFIRIKPSNSVVIRIASDYHSDAILLRLCSPVNAQVMISRRRRRLRQCVPSRQRDSCRNVQRPRLERCNHQPSPPPFHWCPLVLPVGHQLLQPQAARALEQSAFDLSKNDTWP